MSDKADQERVNPATLAARNEREHGPLIDQVLRYYPTLTRDKAERMLQSRVRPHFFGSLSSRPAVVDLLPSAVSSDRGNSAIESRQQLLDDRWLSKPRYQWKPRFPFPNDRCLHGWVSSFCAVFAALRSSR
jgi:hypothetical protein